MSCEQNPSRSAHKRSSYSAIEKFMFCERRFYYDRVLGLPEPPSTALAIGIWYHAALERMVRRPNADIYAVIDEALEEAETDQSWRQPRMVDRLKGYMRANLEALSERGLFLGLRPVSAEEWFKNHRWVGKIDVLAHQTPVEGEDGWEFIPEPCALDWKIVMGQSRRTLRSVREDGQLALYCLMTGRHRAAIVELHKRGPAAAPPRLLTVEYSDDELARWERWFAEIDKTVRARDIHDESAWKLARPSEPLCSPKWCPRWDICPGGANEPNA